MLWGSAAAPAFTVAKPGEQKWRIQLFQVPSTAVNDAVFSLDQVVDAHPSQNHTFLRSSDRSSASDRLHGRPLLGAWPLPPVLVGGVQAGCVLSFCDICVHIAW